MRFISQFFSKIPHSIYLWLAIIIGASSGSVTRKVIEIGEHNLVNGNNPISVCNVLFVGNICAFAVMLPLFYQQLALKVVRQYTRKDWGSLIAIATLSGAIAPGLIFAALDNTNVANVVLIGRLESPISLALGVLFLRTSVNIWTVAGSIISFGGVVAIAFFSSSEPIISTMGGMIELGSGEIQTAIAALILAVAGVLSKLGLRHIPLGFFSLFRTGLGTVIFFILAHYLYGAGHFVAVVSPLLWKWMLLYGAIIVAAGQLFFFAGLKQASFAEITLANSCQPLAAIAIAYLILQEVPTMAQYIGGGIILIGITLGAIGNLRNSH